MTEQITRLCNATPHNQENMNSPTSALEIFQAFADRAVQIGAFQSPLMLEHHKPTKIEIRKCQHLRSAFAGTEVYQLEVGFCVGSFEPQIIHTTGALTGYHLTSGFSILGYGIDDDGVILESPMPGIDTCPPPNDGREFKKQYLIKYETPCSDTWLQ